MEDQASNLVVALLITILALIPLWRVFSRAGLAPALSLLVLVPILGWAIVSLILAVSDWPAFHRKPS